MTRDSDANIGRLTKAILALAARSCGTNMRDAAAQLGIGQKHASDRLSTLKNRHKWITMIQGHRANGIVVLNQYFTSPAAAQAWAHTNPRENQAIIIAHGQSKPKKLNTQRNWSKLGHDPKPREPIKPPAGIAAGAYYRHSMSAAEERAFRGEFGRLRIGQYLEGE